jgi:hypothetical protein
LVMAATELGAASRCGLGRLLPLVLALCLLWWSKSQVGINAPSRSCSIANVSLASRPGRVQSPSVGCSGLLRELARPVEREEGLPTRPVLSWHTFQSILAAYCCASLHDRLISMLILNFLLILWKSLETINHQSHTFSCLIQQRTACEPTQSCPPGCRISGRSRHPGHVLESSNKLALHPTFVKLLAGMVAAFGGVCALWVASFESEGEKDRQAH